MPPSSESWSVPVPPENVAVMVPSLAPLQPSCLARDRGTAVGSVRVLDCDAVHRLASFRTTVCAPPARPVKVTGEVAEANEPLSI